MSTLRALAMLAIAVGCAPATVLADEQVSSARLPELGGAAFTEPAPQTGPAHATPKSCPYQFDSDMPAATFCVYRGVAFGGDGQVCATDVVVIWGAWPAPVSVGSMEKKRGSDKEIYLAFVADPEPVLRAIVDARQDNRAEMVDYTADSDEAPQPLAGKITLRPVRLGSADVLSMDWREPRRFDPGSCAFASYSGTFLGMIGPPSEMTTSVDPFIVPGQ